MPAIKIYGFFNSHNQIGEALGIAIDETGQIVATHLSSNESFAKNDLIKPQVFNQQYPDGWEFEFIRMENNGRENHAGLQAALKLYNQRQKAAQQESDKSAVDELAVARIAGDAVARMLNQLPDKPSQSKALSVCLIVCAGMLKTMESDDFLRGFLESWMAELNKVTH